jgi:hypothetical protein
MAENVSQCKSSECESSETAVVKDLKTKSGFANAEIDRPIAEIDRRITEIDHPNASFGASARTTRSVSRKQREVIPPKPSPIIVSFL